MKPTYEDILKIRSIKGVGDVSTRIFFDEYSSIQQFLENDGEKLLKKGASLKFIKLLKELQYQKKAVEKELELFYESPDIKVVTLFDEDFPSLLREIPDPPLFFYYKGNLNNLTTQTIGIVGSRYISSIGSQNARYFSKELSLHNWIVVSGLAFGGDSAAHRGALEVKKPTVAVLGQGLLASLTDRSSKMSQEILDSKGIIISEFPLKKTGSVYTFPKRNRIISGLSRGVLVVEAKLKSGSLITAKLALDQSREVFAIPNQIRNPLYEGTNTLIKEGNAKLVMNVKDILEEFDLNYSSDLHQEEGNNSLRDSLSCDLERQIWDILLEKSLNIDQLSESLKLQVADFSSSLMMMELSGFIEKNRKGIYCLSLRK